MLAITFCIDVSWLNVIFEVNILFFQVILYKLSGDVVDAASDRSSKPIKKWVYVGYMRAHTHDVRALVVAVPIIREGVLLFFCLIK